MSNEAIRLGLLSIRAQVESLLVQLGEESSHHAEENECLHEESEEITTMGQTHRTFVCSDCGETYGTGEEV